MFRKLNVLLDHELLDFNKHRQTVTGYPICLSIVLDRLNTKKVFVVYLKSTFNWAPRTSGRSDKVSV